MAERSSTRREVWQWGVVKAAAAGGGGGVAQLYKHSCGSSSGSDLFCLSLKLV